MDRVRATFATVICSIISLNASAALVGAVKTDYNVWQTGIDGTASGLSYGADVNFSRSQWFVGAGYTSSQLEESGSTKVSVERADMDFVAGYRLNPEWSMFGGYKKININYDNVTLAQKFDESINALGLGGNISIPFTSRVFGFGTFSVSYLMSQYQGAATLDGSGFHIGQEGGVLYRVSNRFSVAAAIKHQWLSIKYSGASNAWVSDLYRVGANFVYRFDE